MTLITIVSTAQEHQRQWADRFASGLRAHGVTPVMIDVDDTADTEIVCCWGWATGRHYREQGHEVLVAERGYVGDRSYWTSLGWNGLNGRADFRNTDVPGDRWDALFAGYLRPWRRLGANFEGYVLLLGQVPGDQSLLGVDYQQWLNDTVQTLCDLGHDVRWRPHPQTAELGFHFPDPAPIVAGTLAEALAGAKFTVAYNSNSSVDAILAGVPSIVADKGSMAWDVTHPFYRTNRTEWAHRLAYCQWSPEEIADGTAWKHIG